MNFHVGDKFYIGTTQYVVKRRYLTDDTLLATHVELGCDVEITPEILATLATKEIGRSDVALGVQLPRIGPKVGDKFCLSDHPLFVYTVESINLYSYTYVCSVFHLGEGITKYKKVNITNTEVMEAVILPTLEEPPKEIPTHEGLNCAAALEFIAATKKAVDRANKDILESLPYSVADNEIYFSDQGLTEQLPLDQLSKIYPVQLPMQNGEYDLKGLATWLPTESFYPISQEGRGKTPEIFKPTCDHTRATYDSGWSKYDYCTKCDKKLD